MMMSVIGKNKGFTLIEVMAATAILSLGLVLIYQSFFSSIDVFNYYNNYLSASAFANEKVWQAQQNLSQYGSGAYVDKAGVFRANNSIFNWGLSYSTRGENPALYKISFNMRLKRGNRKIDLSRYAYALYEDKEE